MNSDNTARRRPAVDLPVRTCQWHGGRKGPDGWLVYCGKKVRPGSSYCPEHHKRVYQRIAVVGERPAANDDDRQAA